jgi:hypothetical protein
MHSMETSGWPTYKSGMSAPHFSANLLTGERRQHVPMTKASRALARPAGSSPTNQWVGWQIEFMGTCAPDSYWTRNGWRPPPPYLPDIGDAEIEHAARLLADIARAAGFTSLRWIGAGKQFPSADHMSLAEWTAAPGLAKPGELLVVAHADCYAQTHVDVGLMPAGRIVARANQILNPPPPPQEWDEMATKDEFKAAIREVLKEPSVQHDLARAVLLSDGIIPAPRETTTDAAGKPIAGANTHWAAATNLLFDSEANRRIERKLNDILAATKPQE